MTKDRGGARAVAALIAATLATPATARADDPTDAHPTITMRAAPIFGPDASGGEGWNELAVSLENIGGATRRGTIEVSGSSSWRREDTFLTSAPFQLAAGQRAVVKMPTHATAFASGGVTVTVSGDDGAKLASTSVSFNGQATPTLIDVDQPSRLSVVMRNWPIAITWAAPYGASPARAALSTGAPNFDRTTGDPILPDHPAAYAASTVVLIHSDTLAKLEPRPLEALLDWVITGGTIAIVTSRPEDLRERAITALVGGEARVVPAPPLLQSLPIVPRPPAPGAFPSDPPEAPEPDTATPLRFVPISTTTRGKDGGKDGPSAAIRAQLTGYAGGNLAPSVFGASAAYGTGEVHLLPFDPTVAPALDDPWIQSRVVDLVTHAWDRRSVLTVAPGGPGERGDGRIDEVRRALDPNENFRSALGVAAILLVVYSILAGPFTFLRAAKRGKPLLPLAWVPALSAVTFGLVVLVGLAGKGWRGRSRRVALIETGAGVTRGSIRRFRGFFTSDSRALSIASTDAMSLPRLATHDAAANQSSRLQIDRDRATLAGITSLPWQTLVVVEDGSYDLKAGISVIASAAGTDVVNKTGRELRDLLVYTPRDGVRYFPREGDGETLHSPAGKLLVAAATRASRTGSAGVMHPLEAPALGTALGGREGDALARTWRPIEAAVGDTSEWWPDDVPIVLAEIAGGEAKRTDSGLNVESDALLVRVIGRGGAP